MRAQATLLAMTSRRSGVHSPKSPRYSTIAVLSLSHMLNDMSGNFLPQTLPFFVVLMPDFTAMRAALLVSMFTIVSSFSQPLLGYLLDGRGKWWIFNLGTIWMTALLSLTGLLHRFDAVLVLAALAGLGTAAFHPRASTLVNISSGDRKAVLLSAFMAFGNLGFALSPLLLIPLFQARGLQASVFMLLPGVVVALLLLFFTPHGDLTSGPSRTIRQAASSLRAAARELSVLIGVVAIRSVTYTGLLAILPLYFKSRDLSNIALGHLVTVMLASGALGGIVGGLLSDRYGRKQLIVGSLLLATPLFFGFFFAHGALAVVLLGLAGAALMSNFSVTVVAAQEVIPANKALAAGLSMGFAGGIGALVVILVGQIGDLAGLTTAVILLLSLPLVAGLLGLAMSNQPAARIERLRSGAQTV